MRRSRIALLDTPDGISSSLDYIGLESCAECNAVKLLLLHPLPLDGSIFPAALHDLVDECFAPTLYEAGNDITAWARAALDNVGDGPVVIAGNSVGGSCAVEVAHLAPGKVKALVLVGAKPGHRPEPALRDEAVRVLQEDGLRAAWEHYWEPLFGAHASAQAIQQGWQATQRLGADAVIAGVRAFHSRPNREEFLVSWRGPVWVVSGDHDIKPERAKLLADRLVNGSFRRVADAGHYVPLEQPDALVAIVSEALRVSTG